MFYNFFLKKDKIIIVILISFLFSLAISKYNLNNFDKYVVDNNGVEYHQMIKGDPYRYLVDGYIIKEDLKNGKNFFLTGNNYTKYLPSRIAAAYYFFFDINLFDNFSGKINTGIHFLYLILQNLFYYFSVLYLYFSLVKIFTKAVCFFIISFLCIEPTINQYHGSFWHESYSFSFQIILISLMLKNNLKTINFFFIGIFLGLLSAQKQYAIFYVVFVLVFFFYILKNKKFFAIFIITLGFIIIQSFIIYNNKIRSGIFQIVASDLKFAIHMDLVEQVMAKKLNISTNEFRIKEGEIVYNWVKNNVILYDSKKIDELKKDLGFMQVREAIISESDKYKFDNYINKRSINFIFESPAIFFKHVIIKSLHTLLLNPFHIYSDNNFRSGKHYYATSTHNKLIPYRITYSLVIYTICIIGLWKMFREKKNLIIMFFLLSATYFYITVSWHGNTRYFVPVLIYLSIPFGFGAISIVDSLKNYSMLFR